MTYPVKPHNLYRFEGYLVYYDFAQLYHPGHDINRGAGSADLGDPVYAVGDGEVLYSGNHGEGWGNLIYGRFDIGWLRETGLHEWLARHFDLYNGELHFRYGHLQSRAVGRGPITQDQKLGTLGGTGGVSPHLHLDLPIAALPGPGSYVNGKSREWVARHYVNPEWIYPASREDNDMFGDNDRRILKNIEGVAAKSDAREPDTLQRVKKLQAAVAELKAGGGQVDIDALAEAVADKLAARLKE